MSFCIWNPINDNEPKLMITDQKTFEMMRNGAVNTYNQFQLTTLPTVLAEITILHLIEVEISKELFKQKDAMIPISQTN